MKSLKSICNIVYFENWWDQKRLFFFLLTFFLTKIIRKTYPNNDLVIKYLDYFSSLRNQKSPLYKRSRFENNTSWPFAWNPYYSRDDVTWISSKKKKNIAFKSSTESEEEHDDEEVVSSLGNSSAYLTKIKNERKWEIAIKRHPTYVLL